MEQARTVGVSILIARNIIVSKGIFQDI